MMNKSKRKEKFRTQCFEKRRLGYRFTAETTKARKRQ